MIQPRAPTDVHIHYHRPPDRTELFVQRLIHDDPWLKVSLAEAVTLRDPMRIGGRVVLESGADVVWLTFPGAWHDIGRFHLADGTLTGIYANILVPCTFEPGGVWHTTDLFLDLWIPAGPGRWDSGARTSPEVLDRAELERAEAKGWVSSETAERARAEARALVRAAEAGAWPPPAVHEWTRERILGMGPRA